MADAVAHWDRMKPDHREKFAVMLAPLIAASRTKDYETVEKATVQLHTWMISMRDVAPDVLAEAIDVMVNRGVTWMPKPGELKAECAKVIAKRRAAAAKLHADCSTCHGSRWIHTPQGEVRCGCHVRIMTAMNAVGKPLELPAAPDSEA